MNKYIKNINRIEFVITNSCTGKCKHCSQGEHVSNEHIDTELAVQAVHDICNDYKIDSLMTFGGEPLIYPETVFEIHSAAKECGIKYRELITNGYFSKKIDRIQQVAEMLAKSGTNIIKLSVDSFHQETIPLEIVMQFAKEILKTGVSIQTHPAWLISPNDNNRFNDETKNILAEFNKIGIEASDGNIIFASGNALKYFGEYFNDNNEIHNPYLENKNDIKTISFSANGNVLNGNIYNNKITDIISNYEPK